MTLHFILLLSSIFSRKELKIFFHLFLFYLFLLLMTNFLFSKKKALKNLIQTFFIVIILFLLSLNNSVSQLNTKLEVSHFSRFTTNFNPFSLDLELLGRSHFGFIFDRKLTFHQHIHFYSSKALSTVKSMKMLENSLRELLPLQKWLLYQTYIMPITLYRFQL